MTKTYDASWTHLTVVKKSSRLRSKVCLGGNCAETWRWIACDMGWKEANNFDQLNEHLYGSASAADSSTRLACSRELEAAQHSSNNACRQ